MTKDALYNSGLSIRWHDKGLDEKIAFLNERFKRPLPNYVMSYELENELLNNRFNEKAISHLVFDLMRHLKMPFQVIKIVITADNNPMKRCQVIVDKDGNARFSDASETPSVAGQYVSTGFVSREIRINMKEGYNFHTVAAIICHEITHHYLFGRNVRLSDTDENERLTDLAAVYLGFGLYMLLGYKPYKVDRTSTNGSAGTVTKTISYSVGYLKPEQIGYAIKKTNQLRKSFEKSDLAVEREAAKTEKMRKAGEAEAEKLRTRTENMRRELQDRADAAEELLNLNERLVRQIGVTRPHMDAQLFRRVQTNIMNNDQGVYRLQINRCRSGLEKLTPEDCEAALKEINRVCSELNENNALFQKLV